MPTVTTLPEMFEFIVRISGGNIALVIGSYAGVDSNHYTIGQSIAAKLFMHFILE